MSNLFEDTNTKKFFIYNKKKKEVLPMTEPGINKLAKKKLDEIYGDREKLNVPQRFIDNWENIALYTPSGDIDKVHALYSTTEKSAYSLRNSLNDLTAKEWLPETVTVFAQKGLGAKNAHAQIEKEHPAPFSFQDIARLIRFFTKKDAKVLDPFSGVASTVKACAFENRIGYGVELNKKYHELGLKRIQLEVADEESKKRQNLINGDSLKVIKKFDDAYFDFIITSPPYWNILDTVDHKVKQNRIENNLDIKYSDSKNDLANIDSYDKFLDTIASFFSDCGRILKPKKYMCIIVSDFRKKEKYYVFHADLARKLEELGKFKLKGIRILYQRHKSIFPYGYPFSFVPNMHHQNVLILQKQ